MEKSGGVGGHFRALSLWSDRDAARRVIAGCGVSLKDDVSGSGGIIMPLCLLPPSHASQVYRGSIDISHFGQTASQIMSVRSTRAPKFWWLAFLPYSQAQGEGADVRWRRSRKQKYNSASVTALGKERTVIFPIKVVYLSLLSPLPLAASPAFSLCASFRLSHTQFSGSLFWQKTLPPLLITR